ncbi:unnamed protein product, partial [Ectocarpus sp. 13 AM-2016]
MCWVSVAGLLLLPSSSSSLRCGCVAVVVVVVGVIMASIRGRSCCRLHRLRFVGVLTIAEVAATLLALFLAELLRLIPLLVARAGWRRSWHSPNTVHAHGLALIRRNRHIVTDPSIVMEQQPHQYPSSSTLAAIGN